MGFTEGKAAAVQRVTDLLRGQPAESDIQFSDQRMGVLDAEIVTGEPGILTEFRTPQSRHQLGEPGLARDHDEMEPAAVLRLVEIIDGAHRFFAGRSMRDFSA